MIRSKRNTSAGTAKPKRNTSAGTAKPKRNTSAGTAKKRFVAALYKGRVFVGIDLHKMFLQIAAVDDKGNLLMNIRVENNYENIRCHFEMMPANTKYVMESSSVWYGVYRFLKDDLGLDIVLSNPYQTRLIAESKKKTDKVDAEILAEMLRGGYMSAMYQAGILWMQDRWSDTVQNLCDSVPDSRISYTPYCYKSQSRYLERHLAPNL